MTIILPDPKGLITTAGIYDLSEARYHADPCEQPSLSRSVAHTMIDQSPRHGWSCHPRLNPKWKPKELGTESDIGSIAHDIVLGDGNKVVWCDFKDWRTDAAKEARDTALSQDRVPVLLKQKERVDAMLEALHQQLAESDHAKNALKGHKHKTVIWKEEDIWCRAQLDNFDDEFVDDYKTTGGSAEPDDWIRNHLFTDGGHLQSVFYPRGLTAIDGKKRTFRFIVQENYEPFAVSIITVDPHIIAKATEQVEFAINVWSDCTREQKWPAYSKRMVWAKMLPWIESRWEDKKDQIQFQAKLQKQEGTVKDLRAAG